MPDEDMLESILNKNVATSPDEWVATEDLFLTPLLDEINLIQSESVKSFVRAVLLHAPTFWIIPASFSGKHHPPDEFCEGGNVLHTKRVVRILNLIMISQERVGLERDVLLAAALLHDVTKGIQVSEEGISYDPMHPYTVSQLVEIIRGEEESGPLEDGRSNTILLEDEIIVSILRLIRTHMGPWSVVPETAPITSMEWALHIADMVAANLQDVVDFRESTSEQSLDTK